MSLIQIKGSLTQRNEECEKKVADNRGSINSALIGNYTIHRSC
jgi:hypothetical protein